MLRTNVLSHSELSAVFLVDVPFVLRNQKRALSLGVLQVGERLLTQALPCWKGFFLVVSGEEDSG